MGGFWIKTSGQGAKYWSGVLEIGDQKIQVVAFRNDKKPEGSNQPDIRLYLSKPREGQPTSKPAEQPEPKPEVPTIQLDDSEVPF